MKTIDALVFRYTIEEDMSAKGFFGAIYSLRQFSNKSAHQRGLVNIRHNSDGTYSFDSFFDNDSNWELRETLEGSYEGYYEGFEIGDECFTLKVLSIQFTDSDKNVLEDWYLPYRVKEAGAIVENYIRWGQNGDFVQIGFNFAE